MNNKDKEIRKQKRLERFGTNYPACVICGERDDRALELHHIAGRAYGDDLVIVCRNCHSKLSYDQKDHSKGESDITKLVSIGHQHLGLADLFDKLANSLKESGEYLLQVDKEDSK